MNLLGLLHPIYDETIISWLLRCALNPRTVSVTELDIQEWTARQIQKQISGKSTPGLEFDFDIPELAGHLIRLGFNLDRIRLAFKPESPMLLSPSHRLAYCHLCIQEDVASKRFISWRRSWCYVAHPYCATHASLLSFISNGDAGDKHWQAFVNGNSGDYVPGRCSFYHRRVHGLPADKTRALLTLRVQKWLKGVYGTPPHVFPVSNMAVAGIEARQSIELVLRLLLAPRTDRHRPGAAIDAFTAARAVIVHKSMNLRERLEYGAAHSVPYERMSALLLLGIALGIFSAKEKSLLGGLVQKADFLLPDPYTLGVMAVEHVGSNESDDLAEMFRSRAMHAVFGCDFVRGMLSQLT